jgi:Asp-tRNA(Asn)/Glu-tRNA(Gln) amidotransferase A subunit family amidase
MPTDDSCFLTAVEAYDRMRDGRLSSEELVASCLARIAELEETIQAWSFLDPELALASAREADKRRRSGHAVGPLNGLPVGIKDIFDTRDMPTEMGSPLYAGRRPGWDSAVAERLREAGAVILGKTVTTEFAFMHPGKTRNPADPTRTPGGSSSGSAAAVAAFMVPLAIGSQTNGSMIRPASFCNVVGFKPGHGLISRYRALQLSRSLDHVGVFARSVGDAALLAETLAGYDRRDPDTRLGAHNDLARIAASEPPVAPRFAFVRSPVWDEAADDTKAAFEELSAHLGDRVTDVTLPGSFGEAHRYLRQIMSAEMAASLHREHRRGGDRISDTLRTFLDEGSGVSAVDYIAARDRTGRLRDEIEELFHDFDAILTPAAPGEPPVGLEKTGNPTFCTIWTLLGLPAISLPILQGANGMPIGAQLVGAWRDEARLLRTARWLTGTVAD